MITIICIGVVIALAVIAFMAKTFLSKPNKAKKSEKAAIMKQLLALSENESRVSSPAAVQLKRPAATPRKRAAKRASKPVTRASQPIHPSPGHC